METKNYIIDSIRKDPADFYRLVLIPQDGGEVFNFLPGQFARIGIPSIDKPNTGRQFSIASSPSTRTHLEFGFKVYGSWTETLSKQSVGSTLEIMGPLGRFVWNDDIPYAVFLSGGIGITPFVSMMRHMEEAHYDGEVKLIYGSRTPETIAYKDELTTLAQKLNQASIVDVFSDIPAETQVKGYRGFVTEDILKKEVDFSRKPTFFLCGPPVFVNLMNALLKSMDVPPIQIHMELFTAPPPRS